MLKVFAWGIGGILGLILFAAVGYYWDRSYFHEEDMEVRTPVRGASYIIAIMFMMLLGILNFSDSMC